MLVRGQEMNTSNNPVRVDWDSAEWSLVAEELKRLHPSKFNLSYYRFSYSTIDIEDAAEAVLPQHRHRAIDSFDAIKRPLFEAFQRMLPSTKPQLSVVPESFRSDGHIVWKPEEWEGIATELLSLNPAIFENSGIYIGMKIVNEAQLILGVNRRRNFKQLVSFRAQILKTWEQMQAAKRDAPEPVIVDFPSGPIMEPAKTKADDSNALATAMHDAFKAVPEDEKKRKQRVDWTASEWLDIAREMRRQNPHVNFFASKFHNIDLPAIRDAQRNVLEQNRRRTLSATKGMQDPLIKAFAALLAEVNRENSAVKEEEQVAEITVETLPKTPETGEIGEAGKPEAVAEQLAVSKVWAPATVAENTFNGAILNAAAPLISLLVSELTARLAPTIAQLMLPELLKAINAAPKPVIDVYSHFQAPVKPEISAVPSHAVAVPFASSAPAQPAPEAPQKRPTAAEIAAFNGVTSTKQKKQKIVLLGPMGTQKTDIMQSYPNYDFVFIEHGHGIKEAAIGCELFIIYTSHFSAANKASVNKYVPNEKIRQVKGSLSSVKNQIQVWELSKDHVKH